MIILEGPDHSGKSTLGLALSEALGVRVLHPGGAPKTDQQEMNFMIEQRTRCADFIIHDRVTCISQPVYNTMRHGYNDGHYIPYIRHFEHHANVAIIYCRPSTDNMMSMTNHEVKAHETEEHVRMVEQNQRQLIAAYDALMANIQHIRYDYNEHSVKQIIRILRDRNVLK